jgi:lysophospholipase L1-like esterase
MMSSNMTYRLALIGDSDIAYWPSGLYPTIQGTPDPIVSGHSGATLEDVLPYLRALMNEHGSKQPLIILACAGENDIGNGISLDHSVSSLEKFLNLIFGASRENQNHHLIFLGPKFEPWLEDDPSYKKKYGKMSRSFERCCSRHFHSDNVRYIDCLAMFCGDTANIAGAVLGGKAKADDKYFASDRLHLSSHGYKIWNEVVDRQIHEHILK